MTPEQEAESKKFRIPFVCRRSGLKLGDFFPVSSLAGTSPYVHAWKETALYHPIFSLSLPAIIHRATAWHQLEKTGTRKFPMLQKQLLMLAMLHASGCIKQDIPALPSPRITDTFFGQVLEMLGWKNEISSDRLKLPMLHIWKGAAREMQADPFSQIPIWLKACASVKDDYENTVRTRQRAAKQQAANLAMKSIRRNMYEDISLRRLWNWMEAQIDSSLLSTDDSEKELFFVSEKNIQLYTHDEIDDLERLFLENCETGNSISHEVSRRINKIRSQLRIYEDTFEIQVDGATLHPEFHGQPAPEPSQFRNRVEFLVAKAKWELANKGASVPATVPTNASKSMKIKDEDL